MALRHDVQSGAMNLKDKLAIELHSDMRHGKVIYGGEVLTARVCGQYNILYIFRHILINHM